MAPARRYTKLFLTGSPLHPVQQVAAVHAALNQHVVSPSAGHVSTAKHVGHKLSIQPAIALKGMCVMRACQAG